MRYLYRSYCLKEGGIWLGRLTAWRWKPKEKQTNHRGTEKAREVGNRKEKDDAGRLIN